VSVSELMPLADVWDCLCVYRMQDEDNGMPGAALKECGCWFCSTGQDKQARENLFLRQSLGEPFTEIESCLPNADTAL